MNFSKRQDILGRLQFEALAATFGLVLREWRFKEWTQWLQLCVRLEDKWAIHTVTAQGELLYRGLSLFFSESLLREFHALTIRASLVRLACPPKAPLRFDFSLAFCLVVPSGELNCYFQPEKSSCLTKVWILCGCLLTGRPLSGAARLL